MKFMKTLLKIGGALLLIFGAVCVATGYFEQIKDALCGAKSDPSEYDDYADDECEPV
ncbi:MAG: hypothetical protein IJS31_00555 [Oscillospiraceae bacterium]|nr:hypothetical protein [Oscillospiraceae bacterium]